MTDWQPSSLTPSNGDWDQVSRLQFILRTDPLPYGDLDARLGSGIEAPPMMVGTCADPGRGGLLDPPCMANLQGHSMPHAGVYAQGLASGGSDIDLQQGLVDFVRYFLPGSDFDPASGSEVFQLGQFLLDLFARLLTFPGGAALAYSILTALNREVPELGAYLNQESDLSIFEALDSRLGKFIRKLLAGFEAVPVPTPATLQRVEDWIHSVADNYRILEASEIFDEPDFLSGLFRHISDHMEDSIFPGQKAGWIAVVFYVCGLVYQDVNPEIADQLFESGDLFFELSSLLNLDHLRAMDEAPLGHLDRLLAVVDGVEGLLDYGHAVSDLLDPALDPRVSGNAVWPQRIGVMISGIEGILSTGSAIVSLSGAEAILAFSPPLAVGIIICALIGWVIENWDWISAGLQAWKHNWSMFTHIIIPYRAYQGWQWFDDNIGRPVRAHILQPIGQWANHAWNGVTGLVHSLAGD